MTASNLKNVLATNPAAPARSVLASVCRSTKSSLRTPAVQWGKDHEKAALEEYLSTQIQTHLDFNLCGSGLWVSCEVPYLAGSPDGVTECRCCGRGIVEVKCPYQLRDSTMEEFLADKNSCMVADENGCPSLRRKHQHFYQVQAQMYVCDVQFCDFVVHCNKFTIIQRVQYDREFMEATIPKIKVFMTDAVLPQLMAHHFTQW